MERGCPAAHETWVKLKLSEMTKPASSTRFAGLHIDFFKADQRPFCFEGSKGVSSSAVILY